MNERRQPILVSGDPDPEGGGPLVVDGVRWGYLDAGEPRLVPAFQPTRIDPDRVVDVYWWSETFPPEWIAAHGQLAFVMEGTGGVVGDDGAEDIGFVYSVEPFFRAGERFHPLRGMRRRGGYPIVHILTTLSDRVQRAALLYKQGIEAFRLLLNPEQKQALARAAIATASTPRPDERYHTTRKSCVTEAVKVLNQVLPEDQRIPLWHVPGVLHDLRLSLPKRTPGYLIELGLAEPWQSWGADARTLELPQPGGPPFVLDVLAMPGSGVPPGARRLEDALFDYAGKAQALRQVEAEHAGVPADSPGYGARLRERNDAGDALAGSLANVLASALADPAVTVPYMLSLERPETPQAELLIRHLLRRLRASADAGEWPPTAKQAKELRQLELEYAVASGDPEGGEPEPLPEERPLEERPFVPRQRQVRVASDAPDAMVVEDFRWGFHDEGGPRLQPRFATTTIDPTKVTDVYWWSENFPPRWIAAHGQLAFVMEPGGVLDAEGNEALGFVYSVEAHYRVGQSYSPLRGLHPHSEYGMIHILTTLADRVQRAAFLYGHSIDAFRLLLTEQQKQDLVRAAVRVAATPRPDDRYHTTRKSCVTEAIATLNLVLEPEQRIEKWLLPGVLHSLRLSLPKWAPVTMVERGLAEPSASWDVDVRELRFAQRDGGVRVLDALALPGSPVPPSARALEAALHEYAQQAQTLRALARLQRVAPPNAEALFAAQRELAATEHGLAEARQAVLALAAADPAVTGPYLLGLERPDTPQASTLIQALARRLRQQADADEWQPTRPQRAVMDALADPDPVPR